MIARPACSLVSRLTVRYHFERREEWEDSPEGYPQTPPYQRCRRFTDRHPIRSH
jgi:hypothetical protein